jgi:hypothetical protein
MCSGIPCCSDSENKRYSGKLEIAPKKNKTIKTLRKIKRLMLMIANYLVPVILCASEPFATLQKYISLKPFIACNCTTPKRRGKSHHD